MRLTALLFVLSLLAACASPDTNEVPDAAGPDTASSSGYMNTPDAATPPSVESGASFGQRPTAPLRIAGACPFECCTYGTWTTTEPTLVYSQADDTTSSTFTVPAETTLEAVTGHVLLRHIGRALVRDSVYLYIDYDSFRTAEPGDTLFLLENVGEGARNVWYAGSVYQAGYEAFNAMGPSETPPAEILQEGASEWWVNVRTPGGRAGWLWMDQTPTMRGADSCGG